MDIFSDLNKYGLEDITNVDVFEATQEEKKTMKTKVNPESVLYDRSLLCPVCNNHINVRTLKSGKVRLVKTELDLRPIYNGFEPSFYDVVVCNICGYAALNRSFKKISGKQAELIKEKISSRYNGSKYPEIYDYEIAIERHKMALLNAIVGNGKNSEKAYICLRIAWLYRGWKEELLEEEKENDKTTKCDQFEIEFITKAFEGFEKAIQEERFPTMGFDESTMEYLIGELARKLGKYDVAKKYIGRVLANRSATSRLKDKARDVKELILEASGDKKTEDNVDN